MQILILAHSLAILQHNFIFALCIFFNLKAYPPVPYERFEQENIKRIENQIRYHIGEHEPGSLVSQWDYENRRWKI